MLGGLLLQCTTPPQSSIPANPVRAIKALASENYAASVAAFDTLLLAYPDSARWYRLRGFSHDQLQNYQAGVADFTLSLSINPLSAVTWSNRGFAHYHLNNLQASYQDYSQAIHLSPRWGPTYASRGLTLMALTRFRPALADLKEALALGYTCNASVFNLKGYCEWQLDDPRAAIQSYSVALSLDSTYTNAYRNRAEAFRDLHNTTAARRDENRASVLELRKDGGTEQ